MNDQLADKKGPKKFKRTFRPKVCKFCANKTWEIDYKNVTHLHMFVSERGRIIPRRISGNCAKHQRELSREIKKARNIALLPFVDE